MKFGYLVEQTDTFIKYNILPPNFFGLSCVKVVISR